MTVYIRTPYGRFPRYRHMSRFPEIWEAEESQIVNETISLKGEFKNEIDEEANYILQERPSGKFFRSISMSDIMDATKAEAHMENGILTLRIPKAEEAKPKTIRVTTAKK